MVPAQPPLPTASYLPFQSVAGSQISALISESLVGVMVVVTRQNAGSLANAFGDHQSGGNAHDGDVVRFQLTRVRRGNAVERGLGDAVRRIHGIQHRGGCLRMACVAMATCSTSVPSSGSSRAVMVLFSRVKSQRVCCSYGAGS